MSPNVSMVWWGANQTQVYFQTAAPTAFCVCHVCINMNYDAYSPLLTHLGTNKNIINFKHRIVKSYKHIPSKNPRQYIPWKHISAGGTFFLNVTWILCLQDVPTTLNTRCVSPDGWFGGLGFLFLELWDFLMAGFIDCLLLKNSNHFNGWWMLVLSQLRASLSKQEVGHIISHRIHVWYIYLHLPQKSTKCR